MAKRILVTGGCGFIGSNLVRRLTNFTDYKVTVLDKLTYAGPFENIASLVESGKVSFVYGDITQDYPLCELIGENDIVINLAAETHVDRSLVTPLPFMKTNFYGAVNIAEKIRRSGKNIRLLHISTDEVYGASSEPLNEDAPVRPTSPYATSKASADLALQSYIKAFDLDIVIARPTNNYGPYQYPEKLIPVLIHKASQNNPLPLYGDGLYFRDWLFVEDDVDAIILVTERGEKGEIYNVAGKCAMSNIEVARRICELLGRSEQLISYVEDRRVHDRGYTIDDNKIRELGWQPRTNFKEGLKRTIDFYRQLG